MKFHPIKVFFEHFAVWSPAQGTGVIKASKALSLLWGARSFTGNDASWLGCGGYGGHTAS